MKKLQKVTADKASAISYFNNTVQEFPTMVVIKSMGKFYCEVDDCPFLRNNEIIVAQRINKKNKK